MKKKKYKYQGEFVLILLFLLVSLVIITAGVWSVITVNRLNNTKSVNSAMYASNNSSDNISIPYSDGETHVDVSKQIEDTSKHKTPYERAENTVREFAHAHNLSMSMYHEDLIKMLATNPEAENFVLNYPLEKDAVHNIDLSKYESCDEVPYFSQWDYRWGYEIYGADILGITGCGPTCLSMVAIYLLHDTSMNPAYMANYSRENGYCIYGNGTAWALMSEGAQGLGLKAEELPLDKDTVTGRLIDGEPVICIMGPGIFTKEGHFIVLYGYENGKIKLHDPNNNANSKRLWSFEEIENEIYNIWAYRV